MIAASAAIILAASCSSEQDEWSGEIKLRADVDNQMLTRAGTGIQGAQFDFATGTPERINVEIIDAKIDNDGHPTTKPASPTRSSYIFETTNTSGGLTPSGTTPYFPQSGNMVNIFAYYPATVGTTGSGLTTVLDGTNTFSVAADQSNAAGYKASDLMYGVPTGGNPVARTSNTIPLLFAHKLGKVIVRMKGDGLGIQTADLAGATVSMKAMTSAPVTAAGVATSQTWTATDATPVNMGTGTAIQIESVDYYETAAIVVPQSIAIGSEQVFTITLANGGVYHYTPNKALTILPGKVHVFEMTLSLYGINVSATITGWGTDGVGDTQTLII